MPKPPFHIQPYAFVGIDPGSSSGAIAVLHDDPLTQNMTLTVRALSDTYQDTWVSMKTLLNGRKTQAVLEHVWSMPKQGVSSAFKFGGSYGAMCMLLTALEVPWLERTPQRWLKTYGMGRAKGETDTAWKKRLHAKAQQLYPKLDIPRFAADAVLIAHHCRVDFLS